MTKVAKVIINNLLGIKSLEFSPDGTLTEISGDNGEGKTSILKAIKSVVGGSDATLHKGTSKGEVVLLLDDGTQLSNTVTADKNTRAVTRDGKKLAAPATIIKKLTDMMSVNPVAFLTAEKKDRVKVLLESMPIELDMARLSKLAGYEVKTPENMIAMDVLAYVHKQIYEDRTGTNRAVKEKDSSINQLKLALPDLPDGVEGDEDALHAGIEKARETAIAEVQRIAVKIEGIRTEKQEAIAKARADAQTAIDKINAEKQAAIDLASADLAEWEGKAARQKELTKERFDAAVAPLNETLAVLKSNRDVVAKRAQSIIFIDNMKVELEQLEKDVAAQTKALTDIDAYKAELINNLPIKGLEVVNGEVWRDGVIFDDLNTAQQVDIAIQIASLRAGELAIACIDNFEMLSPRAFDEFKIRAEELGLQLFVTRVSDGALSIE